MKVNKTTQIERLEHKLENSMANREKILELGEKESFENLFKNEPQLFVSEQRLFKYMEPDVYESLIDDRVEKKITKLRKQHGKKGVTKVVTEFLKSKEYMSLRFFETIKTGSMGDVEKLAKSVERVIKRANLPKHIAKKLS